MHNSAGLSVHTVSLQQTLVRAGCRFIVAMLITSLIALAAVSLVVGQTKEEKVDYLVLGVSGDWTLVTGNTPKDATAEPLRFGDALHREACVAATGGSLLLWFETGQVTYLCDHDDAGCQKPSGKSCVRRVVKPREQNVTEAVRRLFRAILSLAQRDRSWVTAVSRGVNSRLNDGVVALRGAEIDIGAVLTNLPESAYSLQLLPMQPGLSGVRVEVIWNLRGTASASVNKIKPGLYQITLLDKQMGPTDDEAVILIVRADRYRVLEDDYHEIEKVVRSWPKEIAAGDKRRCLQAYLKVLAEALPPNDNSARPRRN